MPRAVRERLSAARHIIPMAIVYVALGSNLGNREGSLQAALEKMKALPHTRWLRSSAQHETEPVGVPPQGKFLNSVAELETSLPPKELLRHLQQIEQEFGRPAEHDSRSPRVIDLDLLAYDALILREPELEIPHPRMQERPFVLIPLAEIAPEWIHPRLRKSTSALLKELKESAPNANRQASG